MIALGFAFYAQETKRKIIGKVFIDVFDDESHKAEGAKWLAQGTIYPVVELDNSSNFYLLSHNL